MRKIKSILALLLLGTLTMAGCDLKKDDGNTPSEGGGGGDSGGGTVVTEPFKNKKIVFDSLTITPAQSPEVTEQYTASVRGQYVQFFEQGDFETVASNGEHTVVMFGTFTLSEDKLTATATVKGAKTKEGTTPYPEEYWEDAIFDYSATTSKYHVASKIPGPSAEDELTIDSFYVASQEAPQHYVFPQEQKVHITFNANGGEGSMQAVEITSGGSYALPTGEAVKFTREGYEFDGWTLTADGTEVVTALTNVTADVTVYAKWTEKGGEETEHYLNKKIVAESVVVEPESAQETVGPRFENAYISLFEDYEFEMVVLIGESGYQAQFGTFEKTQDGLTATLTTNAYYDTVSEEYVELPSQAQVPACTITFAVETSKYTVSMQVGPETTVTITGSASESAPEHVVMHPVPYVMHGSEAGWEYAHLLEDEGDSNQYTGVVELEKDEEFVICVSKGDGEHQDWRHFENYGTTGVTKKIVQGSETGSDHNFKASEAGTYTFYVRKNASEYDGKTVYILKDGEVLPPFVRHGSDEGGWVDVSLTKTETQFEITDLALRANEEVVFCVVDGANNEVWVHFDKYRSNAEADKGKIGGEGEGNLIALADGLYDFYVKYENDTWNVYVVYDAPEALA